MTTQIHTKMWIIFNERDSICEKIYKKYLLHFSTSNPFDHCCVIFGDASMSFDDERTFDSTHMCFVIPVLSFNQLSDTSIVHNPLFKG
jgi:hypothetical protein